MAESGPQKASEPDPDASRHSETAEEETPAIAAYNTWGGVCLYGGVGSRWCEVSRSN